MVRLALILGLLSAVGPFAIDMYLPALPAIAADLGTTEAGVQLTLTAYFIAFGVAQLFYGPLADAAGRKLPLLLGLGIFAAGSVGAASAGTIEVLAAWRFVQGLGGAALMVVPRAVIRDRYTGTEATRLMAMIMLVISISPMLAPLAGSGVIALAGWRWIFYALLLAGGLSILLLTFGLPETLARESRQTPRLAPMLAGARRLLTDPMFMGLTFVGGFGMASFFVFIASASFVYTQQFGLTPTGFSIAFAINAIGFFGASQVAAPLGARIGIGRLVRIGVSGFATATVLLAAVTLGGLASLPVVVGGLLVANAFMGLVIPTTMVLALEDHGDIAGLASSLGGTLQMLAGGMMITLTGPFFDGTATPMLLAIAICGLLAAGLCWTVLRPVRDPARA
ncbi:drug resistance transporter, Bcr/CflA family protein [Pseudooceanicola batsensis HTCC2597]|uniref:Bcr/CflA family efflux transporter n=1 Tax=Pseudooceanicola batsensis (strain ATCC BAA-863 / DSM 15984 / KCTC 12145 / HTCC2597) TaxID=252305 RepID=A3TSD5_PSEBH|nr:multidrug effflux MFS transporter [Pseudooceanicola batsensis]EAQ04562.1 drug resistance transporter, Bcr/CflA family protein [Pseudooceanicola batsensis HTCC2597]